MPEKFILQTKLPGPADSRSIIPHRGFRRWAQGQPMRPLGRQVELWAH